MPNKAREHFEKFMKKGNSVMPAIIYKASTDKREERVVPEGVLIHDTDLDALFIGDGTTYGGIPAARDSAVVRTIAPAAAATFTIAATMLQVTDCHTDGTLTSASHGLAVGDVIIAKETDSTNVDCVLYTAYTVATIPTANTFTLTGLTPNTDSPGGLTVEFQVQSRITQPTVVYAKSSSGATFTTQAAHALAVGMLIRPRRDSNDGVLKRGNLYRVTSTASTTTFALDGVTTTASQSMIFDVQIKPEDYIYWANGDQLRTGDIVTAGNGTGTLPAGLTNAATYEIIKDDDAGKMYDSSDVLRLLHYSAAKTFTATTAATDLITSTSHGFLSGDCIKLSLDSGSAGGLVDGQLYYAVYSTANAIKLALTRELALAGTAIDITADAGAGDLQKVACLADAGTAGWTLVASDIMIQGHEGMIYVDTGVAVDIYLPDAATSDHKKFFVKKSNASYDVTVKVAPATIGATAGTIDGTAGATGKVLSSGAYDYIEAVSDGTNYLMTEAALVGTVSITGDVDTSLTAVDWDLIDNNASAFSFDATGAAGLLEFVTTNAAEVVKSTMTAGSSILVDADTTDHTGAYVVNIDAGVNSANCDALRVNVDVGTALSAAEVAKGVYVDANPKAADADTSGMIAYDALLTGVSTAQSDLKGYKVAFDGTMDTSDTITGVLVDGASLTVNAASAEVHGVEIAFASLTETDYATGECNALDITMPAAYQGTDIASAIKATGAGAEVDVLSGTSTIYGVNITCAAATQAININAATTDRTVGDVIYADIDVNAAAVNGLHMDFDVGVALSADVCRAVFVDIDGIAASTDTSALVGYEAIISAVSTDRSDLAGLRVQFDGTQDGADTCYGMYVNDDRIQTSATFAGLYVEDAGATHTSGTWYGLFVDSSKVVAGGTLYGGCIELDTANAANAGIGLLVSKDTALTGTPAGNAAVTNNALSVTMDATNACTDGSDVTCAVDALSVSYTSTNTASTAATADTLTGNAVKTTVTANVANDANSIITASPGAMLIDYNLTQAGAGTLTVNSFSILNLDYDTVGAPAFAAGTFNAINVDCDDANTPAIAASGIFNGLQIDTSGLKVSDADLTLNGIKVVMPATYGASTEHGVSVGGDGNTITIADDAVGIAMACAADCVAINIDAGTIDTTAANIIVANVDVNSANCNFISADIDVGTALSAAEIVNGISIDIDGNAADDAGAYLQGIYLTSANTTTGVNRGIEIAGTWDDSIHMTLAAAGSAINIDAGTTDHTSATIITADLDVNSASCTFINADIDVGTALSAAETVRGIAIDINGNASDAADSVVNGIYLTSANTGTGYNTGLYIAGTWDNTIYAQGWNSLGYVSQEKYYWCEDFNEEAAAVTLEAGLRADEWTPAGTNASADDVTYIVAPGGAIQVQTDGADNDSINLTHNIPAINITNNPIIEFRFKVDVVAGGANAAVCALVGLVEAGGFVDKANIELTTDDFILVGIDTDNGHGFGASQIILTTDDTGAAAATGLREDMGVAATANTYITVRIDCTDTEQPRVFVNATGGAITPANEVAAASITGTIQNAIVMYPQIHCQALDGNPRTMTVDYIKVWQDRG